MIPVVSSFFNWLREEPGWKNVNENSSKAELIYARFLGLNEKKQEEAAQEIRRRRMVAWHRRMVAWHRRIITNTKNKKGMLKRTESWVNSHRNQMGDARMPRRVMLELSVHWDDDLRRAVITNRGVTVKVLEMICLFDSSMSLRELAEKKLREGVTLLKIDEFVRSSSK